MKRGDLVRSLRLSRGVGIVVRTYNDPYGLVVRVRWPNGRDKSHRCNSLQIVEEK
jgi:hypothetical protein